MQIVSPFNVRITHDEALILEGFSSVDFYTDPHSSEESITFMMDTGLYDKALQELDLSSTQKIPLTLEVSSTNFTRSFHVVVDSMRILQSGQPSDSNYSRITAVRATVVHGPKASKKSFWQRIKSWIPSKKPNRGTFLKEKSGDSFPHLEIPQEV